MLPLVMRERMVDETDLGREEVEEEEEEEADDGAIDTIMDVGMCAMGVSIRSAR